MTDVLQFPPPNEDDTRPTEAFEPLDEPPLQEGDTRPNSVPASDFAEPPPAEDDTRPNDVISVLDEPPINADDTQPTPLAPMAPVPVSQTPTPPRPMPAVQLPTAVPRRRARWRLLVLVALIIGIAIVLAAALVLLSRPPTAASNQQVTVYADGQTYELATNVLTVREVLTALGLVAGASDLLSHPLDQQILDGMEIYLERARVVTLIIDGALRQVQTTRRDPLAILTDFEITLAADDRVWIDGSETQIADLPLWPVPVTQITIRRAVTLVIVDGDLRREVRTTADTIGDALFDAGVTLFLADLVSPELNTAPADGMVVTVDRSRPVTISVDGATIETRVNGGTVADALVEAGVTLIGQDYTVPSESAEIRPGMTVRVIRVTEEVLAEYAAIPFETVFQADSSLELDQQRVAQIGQDGVSQRNIRVRYENGVEVSREQETEFVAQDPVNRVIAYGTAVVIRSLDTPEGPVQYWRTIRVYATSYHPAALGGDNITATGATLTKGIIGADPDVLPYHTQLYVPGYGIGQIEDTGGPRRSARWIDLGYDDENWVGWSRYVDVYLLTPVPADIIYILPP